MVREAGVTVFVRHRLREKTGVARDGPRLRSITMENGARFEATVFADTTYEGDLMAQAGVTYRVGREGTSQYGSRSRASAIARPSISSRCHSRPTTLEGSSCPRSHRRSARPRAPRTPRCRPTTSASARPRWRPTACRSRSRRATTPRATRCSGHACRRWTPSRRRPQAHPPPRARRPDVPPETAVVALGRDEARSACPTARPTPTTTARSRTDHIGGNYDYPDADYATRARRSGRTTGLHQGLFYFLANDPRVPRRCTHADERRGASPRTSSPTTTTGRTSSTSARRGAWSASTS